MVRVTVIGSGDAFGSGGRGSSAYLVEGPTATFLVDCGPTVLPGLKQRGCDPGAIDFVLLSHLHGDHFGGVPFLFLEYLYGVPRTRPLAILGPPDTERRIRALYAALYERIATEPLPFPVAFREIAPGATLTLNGVTLLPFRVPHAPELVCFGFRVDVGGRSIVYSGDTSWTEDLVKHARGVDLLVCECSCFEAALGHHLTYREIAARARDFGCRRIILSHLGREPLAHRSELTLECAEDGMQIEL